jgi:hypothetical protein
MTVIFQLFSAEDLQQLNQEQLKQLRDIIRDELETSSQIRATLKPRAEEVLRQLLPASTYSLPASLPSPPSLDPLQSLPNQLFRAEELAQLDGTKLKILEWAIECERNSSPHVLDVIRKRVYAWFQGLPGKSSTSIPKPDAEYSSYSRNYEAVRVKEPYIDFTLIEKDWESAPPKS